MTGRLIDRFGYLLVMLSGVALIAAGAIIALSGEQLAHFWTTLILLGVGWNLAYTGSTVMIAKASAQDVRLQGAADFAIFGFVAASSLLAGALFHLADWVALNVLVLVILALASGAILVNRLLSS
ncbi:hypothetical protein [Falsirhodobacter sp. 20TX0035]|uniref:hypothetical protein n=1 Tax=Falsirhodobacter sp. 20TX0035 TaxID=3022019 RepID=UPI00232D06DA|nr:hypothetical protein [Falsirhodobacter sp. 20TX0035]MDB6454949.1 hypothetical protein [Falsirhodobacter sp. 20TX0035]